jgi:TolB protein
MQRNLIVSFCLLAAALPLAAPAFAQDQPAGIRLGAPYNVQRPLLAVQPFNGAEPIAEAVDSVTRIIQRDLRFSSRFTMLDPIPRELQLGPIDYRPWNALNVVYVVAGELTPGTRGYTLALTVHDVVYSRVINERRFNLPAATDPDFRMAVHAVSDEIVRWTLNQPGSAATRIAVTRQNGGGSYDLLLVDSDGFGMRRIAGAGVQLYSPTWSPDGRRVLYAFNDENRGWVLVERDVQSGSQRTVNPGGQMLVTPTYRPDGQRIALAAWRDDGMEIFEYDLAQQCCLRRLTGTGRTISQNPAYSPDGRQLAFNSDRAGNNAVYVMPADGSGAPAQLSPFSRGSSYTAPTWAPTGSRVAFAGWWSRQFYDQAQIMIADATRPGAQIEQITTRGNNRDPSWAPDGRNIVYTSAGDGAAGLYVIDAETKTRRLLAAGGNLRMAEWSPVLLRAADLVAQ